MALVKPIPTPYQKKALKILTASRDKKRLLTVLPSGSGKTYLVAFDCLKVNAQSVLYIAHRNEIIEQAVNVFTEVLGLGKRDIGFITGAQKDYARAFTFASIQTLAKEKHISAYLANREKLDYVIFDEYHHIAAESYQRVLKIVGGMATFIHGITATPYRSDGRQIEQYADNNIGFSAELPKAIQDKELVPFHYYGLWDNVDYSGIRWQGYGYKQKDLDKTLLIDRRDRAIIRQFKKSVGDDKQTIAFCATIKHIYRMVDKFNAAGISAAGIDHKSRLLDRRRIVKDFRDGRIQVLFVRDVFNEGIDFPNVKSLLFLRPTWSKTVFFQQLGRGLRKAEGKSHVDVYDLIGNYANAFRINKWVQQAIKLTDRKRLRKPEYEHLVSTVWFDQRVVDLFKYQSEHQRHHHIADDKLIDEYKVLRSKLGRNPTTKEMARMGTYSISHYFHRWHSWFGFLRFMQQDVISPSHEIYDKKILILAYQDLKTKLDRIPTRDDWREEYYNPNSRNTIISQHQYTRVFGGWKALKLAAGDSGDQLKNKIMEMYLDLKNSLGRRPIYAEWRTRYKDRHLPMMSAIIRLYGTWSDLIKAAGDKAYGYKRIPPLKDQKSGWFLEARD